PDQLEELEHPDDILLRELQRTDELLLEELERVDEMLLRIVAELDQLPERVVSAGRGEPLRSVPGNGTGTADPAPTRVLTRPFDPYREDEVEAAADEKQSAAGQVAMQVARKVEAWIALHAQGREVSLSLAVAVLAASLAVVGLIVAVLQ